MKTPINPIRLWAGIVLIALQVLLSSCSSTKQIEWKEEVMLQTGDLIEIRQELKLQENFELSQGRSWVPREQTIHIKHPLLNNGQETTWSLDALPMILDYDIKRQRFYIVATVVLCIQDRALGSPRPPYLVFEYFDNTWQRVNLRDELIGKHANLLVGDSSDIGGSKLSLRKKTELNADQFLPKRLLTVDIRYPVTC